MILFGAISIIIFQNNQHKYDFRDNLYQKILVFLKNILGKAPLLASHHLTIEINRNNSFIFTLNPSLSIVYILHSNLKIKGHTFLFMRISIRLWWQSWSKAFDVSISKIYTQSYLRNTLLSQLPYVMVELFYF